MAVIVPRRWLAWTLGMFALLEFLVGGWMIWRFQGDPPPGPVSARASGVAPDRPAPEPVGAALRGIAAVPLVMSFVLFFIVMGVIVWHVWKVGLAPLR